MPTDDKIDGFSLFGEIAMDSKLMMKLIDGK